MNVMGFQERWWHDARPRYPENTIRLIFHPRQKASPSEILSQQYSAAIACVTQAPVTKAVDSAKFSRVRASRMYNSVTVAPETYGCMTYKTFFGTPYGTVRNHIRFERLTASSLEGARRVS